MTLAELIAKFRTDADDIAEGTLASDENVTDWLNEAEEEAALRARLIHESVNSAICEISISAGDTVYPLHESIFDITRADFTPDGGTPVQIQIYDRIELDRLRPGWRVASESLRDIIQQDTSIRTGCIPNVAGTLKIECYRAPLDLMTVDQAETVSPEIGRAHHRHLVQWALYKNYSRPDAEVHDPKRAAMALEEFARIFGEHPDADMRRSHQANRPLYNKAIA